MAKPLTGMMGLFLLFPVLAESQEGFRKVGVAHSKELGITLDLLATDSFSGRVTFFPDFKLSWEKSTTTGDFLSFYVVCTATRRFKDDKGLRYAPYDARDVSLGGPRVFPNNFKLAERTQIKLYIDPDSVREIRTVKFFLE